MICVGQSFLVLSVGRSLSVFLPSFAKASFLKTELDKPNFQFGSEVLQSQAGVNTA